MQALREKLNKPKTIRKVLAKDLKDAVRIVYNSSKYNFYLNSELIDVNNRFRIFEFNNTKWLSKKSKTHKALKEYQNAKKVEKVLNGTTINDKEVSILVPTIIEDGDYTYLLTQYTGQSLQEVLYSDINTAFTFNDLQQLLKIFDVNNIVFRGLLPRNLIVSKYKINIIDWEDIIFYPNRSETYLNMQFKTNFLLNWGYFFDKKDLQQLIDYINKNKSVQEPELNKYELTFKSFNKREIAINRLREKIFQIVLFSEKDIQDDTNKFVIKPQDMAHLMSDLFTNEIDVLFDVCVYNLRRTNEDAYNKFLFALSNQIIKQYKENNLNRFDLILYVILLLEDDFNKICKYIDNIDALKNYVNKSKKQTISKLFINGDISLAREDLSKQISKNIKLVDAEFDFDENFCNKVYNYLENLTESNSYIYEDMFFALVQNLEYKNFPRFYSLKLKSGYSIEGQMEIINDLSKLQKIIREAYNTYGIKQVGIYAEQNGKTFQVNFIPYYQTILNKLRINPDDYQPSLPIYLQKHVVDEDKIKLINLDMAKRIQKRIKEYEK